MQPSIHKTQTDSDDIKGAKAEVVEQKAKPTDSLHQSGQRLFKDLGPEVKPALVAGLAVAAVVTIAGVAIAVSRRRRAGGWLRPARPSALGVAARGAGIFLLRFAARQVASHLLTKLEDATGVPGVLNPEGRTQASLR